MCLALKNACLSKKKLKLQKRKVTKKYCFYIRSGFGFGLLTMIIIFG